MAKLSIGPAGHDACSGHCIQFAECRIACYATGFQWKPHFSRAMRAIFQFPCTCRYCARWLLLPPRGENLPQGLGRKSRLAVLVPVYRNWKNAIDQARHMLSRRNSGAIASAREGHEAYRSDGCSACFQRDCPPHQPRHCAGADPGEPADLSCRSVTPSPDCKEAPSRRSWSSLFGKSGSAKAL